MAVDGSIRPLPFTEALDRADGSKHILLGNGFSRACRNDIFGYDSLFARADFSRQSPNAKQAFAKLGTTDFEAVMRALKTSAALVELYEPARQDFADALRRDADGLRDVLASAIAQNHPELPSEISNDRYRSCRTFLSHFSKIYSVNYDLLLYWALMQNELEPAVVCDDGFRKPDDPHADYVTWEPENRHGQNVHYLHGALHLFDAGPELKKYTWVNTGIRLVEQIRSALAAGLYPHIVAEGTSQAKKEKIVHSMYLSHSYKSMLSIGGSLFVYGLAFHDNDAHISHILTRNHGLKSLVVSVYGDPASQDNAPMMLKVRAISEMHRPQLDLFFFDAQSARVWG